MSFKLEIACFNFESAITACRLGADRIELCEDYEKGGVTPNKDLIEKVRKSINIPLHVIIRPRGGNFFYTDDEIRLMEKQIVFCQEQKVDGVVFGILNCDNTIDEANCQKLAKLAKPMKITFHRAIDECNDMENEIRKLVEIGFDCLLTSGGKSSVMEGIGNIRNLQTRFKNKIIILPGGGVRSQNLKEIIDRTGCNEFHTSAIVGDFSSDEVKRLKKIILL